MKKKKDNTDKKNLPEKLVTNAGGKPIVVGPEEYEEDISMEIRMKPQELGGDEKKKEEE